MSLIKCSECGKQFSDKAKACPNCACPIGEIIKTKNNKTKNNKNNNNTGLMVIIFVAVFLLFILIISRLNNKKIADKNFNTIFENIGRTCSSGCYISSDGSYLKLDTKPLDSESYDSSSVSLLIEDVNKELGFSSSLYAKMESSRGIDGKQTDENDYVKVTWSYLSSKGLEVIYEFK